MLLSIKRQDNLSISTTQFQEGRASARYNSPGPLLHQNTSLSAHQRNALIGHSQGWVDGGSEGFMLHVENDAGVWVIKQ